MEQIRHHLMASVNVNILTLFVSDLPDMGLTNWPHVHCSHVCQSIILGIRMRMMPHARMGRAAQVSGVASLALVGVQRAAQNNGNVKSEPKYLACEESPVCAFYC